MPARAEGHHAAALTWPGSSRLGSPTRLCLPGPGLRRESPHGDGAYRAYLAQVHQQSIQQSSRLVPSVRCTDDRGGRWLTCSSCDYTVMNPLAHSHDVARAEGHHAAALTWPGSPTTVTTAHDEVPARAEGHHAAALTWPGSPWPSCRSPPTVTTQRRCLPGPGLPQPKQKTSGLVTSFRRADGGGGR